MKNLNNPSFENGWTDIVTGEDYGWLINQNPTDWHLRWLWPGESLFGTDEARGVPECVHKLTEQLPPNEQPGGSDPLILNGEHVYKIFHNGAAFGAEIWQIVEGLEPGTTAKITVPVRIHAHKEKESTDTYAAESGVWLLDDWTIQGDLLAPLNGSGDWVPLTRNRQWKEIPGVKPDGWQWYYHEEEILVPPSGTVCVLVRVKSKWDKPVDFFIDDLKFEAESNGGTEPPDPPSDLEQRVTALELRVLQLESEAHTHDTTEPPISIPGLGMDVSHWNGPIDWDKTKESGIEYAFIKATEGSSFVDSRFGENWGESKRAGVPRAAYHYFRFGIDATKQAKHFWDVVGELGDLPHVVDIEDTKVTADSNALKTFIDRLTELSGSKPIIYTGAWFWNNARWGGPIDWASDYLLWCADYRDVEAPRIPTDWDTWHIWQYTSTGDGPTYGATGDNLDLNRTNDDTPEPGETIDITHAILGTNGQQFDMDYGTGTQTTMISHRSDPQSILYVKGTNGEYERLFIDKHQGVDWFFRADDTSESTTRMYAQYEHEHGMLGAPWFPCHAVVGKWYETTKFIQHYLKDGCVKQNSGTVTDKLRLISEPYNRTYPTTGKTEKVITIEWASGEQYDFSWDRGGNIGFRKTNGVNFEFMGWLEGRQPLTIKKYDCFGW